ncbi:MAG: trigger factor [Dehalococcoidia bacterium]|nr:trigger factor [Dehalococcoidia bacterium]
MKVSAQRLPESQIVLEIEVDPDQMERSLDRAYRRLVQRVDVPGFRKGKTPRSMLERHLGRDRLLREAIDILIPEAYNQAIDAQDIDAIDQPQIELIKDEPLAFKATVPLRPTVELGDYQSLRVARQPVAVDEKDVDGALEELQRRYALHEPVDRPVQTGDIVTASVRMVIEDREVFKDDDAEFRLREGVTILLPGFADGLAGAKKGEAREITVTVPPGEQPLSGKSGTATTLVKEIKQERLPELTDDFAREVGEGFAGLEALRDRLREDLRERLQAQAEEAYREQALTALVESAEAMEFPPVLVDREIERLIRDHARSAGRDVDSYLELIKRDVSQLRDELAPVATERVRRSLVLSRLAEDEKIEVESAEVDAEIEKIVSSSGQQEEQLRRLFAGPEARASIERSLLTRKTADRLVEIAGRAGVEKPAKKKRARKTETEEAP